MKKLYVGLFIFIITGICAFGGTKLKPIENLKVVKVTSQSVELKWEEINGATSYEVYRQIKGQNEKIAEIKFSEFTDSSVKSKETYYYFVIAKNAESTSERSYLYPILIPDSGSMTTPEKFVIFQPEELNNLVVTFDKTTLVIKNNEKTKNIKVGYTLLSEKSDKISRGLMNKVVSKTELNGNIKLKLEPGNLTEMLESMGDATYSKTLPLEMAEITYFE